MKINYIIALFFFAFVSIVVIANIQDTTLIGCTELNGSGCVCHSLEQDTLVNVWVEGPDTLEIGKTGHYRMYMAGGPAEGGGYNVAGRFGEMALVDTFSIQHPMAMNELTQAFTLPFPNPEDTIFWEFGYTASDSSAEWDTIYSCGISLVWDSIPDALDRWNFGPKFPIRVIDKVTGYAGQDNKNNGYVLHQNYPNPFNPSTKIKLTIPSVTMSGVEGSRVSLKVYDVLGNEVAILINEYKEAGDYEVKFNASNLPTGIYFYKLEAGHFIETKKMILMK